MSTPKAPARMVVVVGNVNRFVLRHYVTPTDKVWHAPRPPYFGKRDGMDDEMWQAHKDAKSAAVDAIALHALTPAADAMDAGNPVVVILASGWDAYDADAGIYPQVGAVQILRDFTEYADVSDAATVHRLADAVQSEASPF